MTKNIITCARTWLGTPFHHQGRLKGVGCDCLGLILGAAAEANITHNGQHFYVFDNNRYATTPNTAELLLKLDQCLTTVSIAPQEGDLALMRIQQNPQHLAFITQHPQGGLGLLHSLHGQGVVEHRLSHEWERRIYKFYRTET